MKKIQLLLALLFLHAALAQNPAKFKDGIKLPNATEAITPSRIPAIDVNGNITQFITPNLSSFNDDIGAVDTSVILVKSREQLANTTLVSDKPYIVTQPITFLANDKIIVPTTGLTIKGLGFNVSSLNNFSDNQTLFTSPAEGSGDLIIQDLNITVTGDNSQVFNIIDSDGNHAIELEYINFTGCKSLGEISDYRQGTATTCGVYGVQDGLTLSESWSGFKITNTNIFGFASTGTFIKQGTNTTFSNRLFLNLNLDFPTGAKLIDFDNTNFESDELLQINSSIAKLNGVIDINNAQALIPNISANDNKSLWIGNIGLPDTATEKYIEDLNVNTTYNIDWLNDTYYLELTGDTTFTQSNLPANNKNTQEIKIYLTGDYVPTFPASWLVNLVGTYKPQDVNEISIKYIKDGVYFVRISNSLSVYPAPILGSLNPVSLLPDSTSELVISGSFYTPEGFVLIDGQVVNSIEFDPDTGNYILSVTTGSLEGEFDITISNGTSVTFESRMIVNLGEVFVPEPTDWESVTGSIDNTEVGRVKLVTEGVNGKAQWKELIDLTRNLQIKFKLSQSLISTTTAFVFTPGINLIDQSNSIIKGIGFQRNTGGRIAVVKTNNKNPNGILYSYVVGSENPEIKLDWNATTEVMNIYKENTLIGTWTSGSFNKNNYKLEFQVKYYLDITNIKYIELPE